MRQVKVKWNQRNIERMTKWLKLDQDFSGRFNSPYGKGYKTASAKYMTYVFTGAN